LPAGGRNPTCAPRVRGIGEAEPAPIKTYSLEEVAVMILPPDIGNAVRWLGKQIRSGRAPAYKAGRSWRMTQQDVEDFIARPSDVAAR
jgi:hypothetical protein